MTREEALQRKYPGLTNGKIITKDAQTLAYLTSRGWEPNAVVVVENACIHEAEDAEIVLVRWGFGANDSAAVLAEDFEAIARSKGSSFAAAG